MLPMYTYVYFKLFSEKCYSKNSVNNEKEALQHVTYAYFCMLHTILWKLPYKNYINNVKKALLHVTYA